MRVMIVGAGIGGLTLAALLSRRGMKPLVVERAADFSHERYPLALYTLGSRILHGLGLFERFVARSEAMETYRVHNGHGALIHEYDLGALAGRIGPIRQLTRAELLTRLREGADRADLRMATTLEAARPEGDAIAVRLSDGTETSVDLLVGADGIHSQIRRDFFGEAATHSSGWGAWVWWADKALVRHDTIAEYWGAGRFVGAYPTRERIGLIAGGSEARLGPAAIGEHTAALRRELAGLGDSVAPLLGTMPAATADMFYWRLDDCRAPSWRAGRVALLGDSACGFLPTAGIGASMAMESAAVLADELDRTDAKFLPKALALYEKRRRKRAEAAQDDSRHLGSMMFVDSLPLAWGRDQLLKFYSLEMLAKQIAKSLDEPI